MQIYKLNEGRDPGYVGHPRMPQMTCPDCERVHVWSALGPLPPNNWLHQEVVQCGNCGTYIKEGVAIDLNHVIQEGGVFYEVQEHDIN